MEPSDRENKKTQLTSGSPYPFEAIELKWKRPSIDRELFRQCTRSSDAQGWFHCLGVLAILAASGSISYYFFLQQQWLWMALALYVHGGLVAFNPQTHEFSHGTVFKTAWLNHIFKHLFEMIHWTANGAEYRMSHTYHHRYTTHRKAEGEVVLPMPRTWEQVISQAITIVDFNGFICAVYGHIYGLIVPYLENPRKIVWMRYAYANSSPSERRAAYRLQLSQLAFHGTLAVAAIATGHWFVIVVVTLPMFYGGRWYHFLVHDTMHSGRQPETDDFRLCCRSVRLDPFTSFMYWHMEWHTEHHTFPGVPCYHLKTLHHRTRDEWDKPMSLMAAWQEMNQDARRELALGSDA